MLTSLFLSALISQCNGPTCQRPVVRHNPTGAAYSVPATYRVAPRTVLVQRRWLLGWRRAR